MSNYVTNYLQTITSTLTQVNMCRYPFQSNYSVVLTPADILRQLREAAINLPTVLTNYVSVALFISWVDVGRCFFHLFSYMDKTRPRESTEHCMKVYTSS